MKTIAHVIGARPNYMKIAPVMEALAGVEGIEQRLVGQPDRATQSQSRQSIRRVMQASDFQLGNPHQVRAPLRKPEFAFDVAQTPVAFVPGLIQTKGKYLPSGADHAACPTVLPVYHLDAIAELLPAMMANTGGALWLRRTVVSQ
jgi:hypothetical protein